MKHVKGKFVPYEKLSKKAKREMDAKKRVTWGEMSPVTRKPERTDIYDRNAEKRRLMRARENGASWGGFI
jgi:hypothetical protein